MDSETESAIQATAEAAQAHGGQFEITQLFWLLLIASIVSMLGSATAR